MKSPPLHPHHSKLHEQITNTPPSSPLPTSGANGSSQPSGTNTAAAAAAAAASLLLFNKHQLNNYNSFLDYFDKVNATTATPSDLKAGVSTTGGGRKRELTPNQSADELHMQLNNYLNPSYEDLNGGHVKTSNSSGTFSPNLHTHFSVLAFT